MADSVTVLENESRRMIYNHIMAHPGVSFIILKDVFNINESTLRYHLNYLEKNEKINFSLETGKRYYYPHTGNNQVVQTQGNSTASGFDTIKLTAVQEKITATIKRYPMINQKELIDRTRINRITLNKNLDKLNDLCIVRKIPNGNKINYEYIDNKQLRYKILKRLLIKLLHNEIDENTFLELKRKLD